MTLMGWGRYPSIHTKVNAPRTFTELRALTNQGNAIAHGNGRAYGDSAVNTENTIHLKHFNRMLAFDEELGQLIAEAGVLLADIINVFTPQGWFPAVTPGTKFVTLGGMIAADVHGKNHHKDGSFGNYVDWFDMITADGDVKRCSKTENPELFEWTIGGMGLTGIIIRTAVRLRPISSAWIKQQTLVADNLSDAIELFENSDQATYSVAWIDCLQTGSALGRSILMLGEHAEADQVPKQHIKAPLQLVPKRQLNIVTEFPSWALNTWSVRAFNSIYYWLGNRKLEHQIVDIDSFFYPLDTLQNWNKIYGRRGFAQYQCVIPLANSEQALRELIGMIAEAKSGSFLAVLKRFGKQEGRFSFPMEGYTLALDFPISRKTLKLMDKLDNITLNYGGRIYLAKDSRMSPETFKRSDPRADEYRKYREKNCAVNKYLSAQSQRLDL